jgi:tetratricopeptide (TPR) repeat protein
VYVGLENRGAAARCFKVRSLLRLGSPPRVRSRLHVSQAALAIDPLCYEAFDALASGHMLTPTQEAAMLATLQWAPGDSWVGALYGLQAAAHNPGADLPAQLEMLDRAATAAGVGDAAVAALRENADVVAATAEWSLARGEVSAAYAATSALLARDPLRASALPTHLSAAATLGKRNELFSRGHELVQADPESGVAWYAVGCYYACAGQHAAARRFLAKCTAVAPGFAPGWLAYGHAFAALDETDQALAAYRTAARLFPGTPAPLLWVGVEYGRAANWPLARQFLQMASDACPGDPAPHHELGCVELRAGEPQAAQAAFEQALGLAPQPLTETWEVRPLPLGAPDCTASDARACMRSPRCSAWATRCASKATGTRPRRRTPARWGSCRGRPPPSSPWPSRRSFEATTPLRLSCTTLRWGCGPTTGACSFLRHAVAPASHVSACSFAQEMLTEALADACAAY